MTTRKTLLSLMIGLSLGTIQADINFRLPTDNEKVFSGNNEEFYMHVDRYEEGIKSTPWEGGTYGFVRNVIKTPTGPVCAKFHEGIDIKPLARTPDGTPIDAVRPTAPGIVVYTNGQPGKSSYGRYVVLQHNTQEGPIYTLYAHLASISCSIGDKVSTGNTLGVLGYSGTGINKTRSHIHFETALLLNPRFDSWITGENNHGLYHGFNLSGFSPIPLLTACREGKHPTLSQYLSTLPKGYTVRVQGEKIPLMARVYPCLIKNPNKLAVEQVRSWDITFTSEGTPLQFSPSTETVDNPSVIWLTPSPINPLYRTAYRIKSAGPRQYALTSSGLRYIDLIIFGRDETP